MRRTHAAAGLMIGFGLVASYHPPTPLLTGVFIALVSQAASLVPDLDLKLKLKHRGLTHSLLALLIVAALALSIGGSTTEMFRRSVPLAFIMGYASHLFLDLLTVQGIELFYPCHRRIRLLKFRTNSRVDHLVGAASLCVGLYFLWGMFP